MRNALFITLIMLVGCGPLTIDPKKPDSKDDVKPVVVERAPAEEIWIALSHAIKAKSITNLDRLKSVVGRLKRNGDLSGEDVAKFDAEFQNEKDAGRMLNDSDAAKLKGLK